MKIFISWSGELSGEVAKLLHKWLPDVIFGLKPWMSEEDIESGARGLSEIADQLDANQFGIICVTGGNQHKPWLNFEAGALAHNITNANVCPLLIDQRGSALEGPLAQFQYRVATKAGIMKLIETVNAKLGEAAMETDRLQRSFDRCWKEFDDEFKRILKDNAQREIETSERSDSEVLHELLEISRALQREAQAQTLGFQEIYSSLHESIRDMSSRKEAALWQTAISRNFLSEISKRGLGGLEVSGSVSLGAREDVKTPALDSLVAPRGDPDDPRGDPDAPPGDPDAPPGDPDPQ